MQRTAKMINLYYDDPIHGNCGQKENSPVRPVISINEHFDIAGIPYSIKSFNDEITEGEFNLYVIEIFYVQRLAEAFANIPDETMKTLQSGKLKLLIYFPYEGFRLSLYNNWFLELHQCFQKYNLQNVKKYFVYNNLSIEQQYNDLLAKNEIPSDVQFRHVYGYPFFHLEHHHTMSQRWANPITKEKESVNLQNVFEKEKNFLSMNAKMRAHRLLLISELERRKVLEDSFTSFIGDNVWDWHENTVEFAYNALKNVFATDETNMQMISSDVKEYLAHYVNNWSPRLLDVGPSNLDLMAVVPKYYERTYFSLVTETGMDHYLRMTEKTFKPFANYHPFLIVGCHGTLEYLRKIGYETFPEMFDESYDEETYIPKRLLMVADQVEAFCNLSKEEKDKRFKSVHEKTLHNANMFWNVHPENNKRELKKLFESIRDD